eukprot:3931871-Rhodomonas_salina.1
MPSMESSNHMLPPPQCPALPHDCSGGESYVLQQAPPVWTRRECDVGLVSARNCEDRPGFTQKKMRQSALAVAAFALVALISILVVSDGERRTEDFAKQEFFTGREGDRELARSDSWQYPPPSGDRAPLPHRDSSPIEYVRRSSNVLLRNTSQSDMPWCEQAGRGKGWPLKSSGATFQRPERSFDRSHTDEEERETDKGQSWLNVGTYGVVPRVDGNLDGQLEDPKVALSSFSILHAIEFVIADSGSHARRRIARALRIPFPWGARVASEEE